MNSTYFAKSVVVTLSMRVLVVVAVLGWATVPTAFGQSITNNLEFLFEFEDSNDLGDNSIAGNDDATYVGANMAQSTGKIGSGAADFSAAQQTQINVAGSADVAATQPGSAGTTSVGGWFKVGDGTPATIRFWSMYDNSAAPSSDWLAAQHNFFATSTAGDGSSYRHESWNGSAAPNTPPLVNALDVNNVASSRSLNGTGWNHMVNTTTLAGGTRTVEVYINGVLDATGSRGSDPMNFQTLRLGQSIDASLVSHATNGTGYGKLGVPAEQDDFAVWGGHPGARGIAAIAGLGEHAGVGLGDAAAIDAVLALNSVGATASAGGLPWTYTQTFDTPSDSSALVMGKNYTGTDGLPYIILDDLGGGNFGGVVAPEPTALALLACGLVTLLANRVRRRR